MHVHMTCFAEGVLRDSLACYGRIWLIFTIVARTKAPLGSFMTSMCQWRPLATLCCDFCLAPSGLKKGQGQPSAKQPRAPHGMVLNLAVQNNQQQRVSLGVHRLVSEFGNCVRQIKKGGCTRHLPQELWGPVHFSRWRQDCCPARHTRALTCCSKAYSPGQEFAPAKFLLRTLQTLTLKVF